MPTASDYRAKAAAALAYADAATSRMLVQQWARTAREWTEMAVSAEAREKLDRKLHA